MVTTTRRRSSRGVRRPAGTHSNRSYASSLLGEPSASLLRTSASTGTVEHSPSPQPTAATQLCQCDVANHLSNADEPLEHLHGNTAVCVKQGGAARRSATWPWRAAATWDDQDRGVFEAMDGMLIGVAEAAEDGKGKCWGWYPPQAEKTSTNGASTLGTAPSRRPSPPFRCAAARRARWSATPTSIGTRSRLPSTTAWPTLPRFGGPAACAAVL